MIAMQYGAQGKSSSPRISLIWENTSPTTAFAAQSIPADLSGCRFFGVVIRFSTSTADNPPMQIFEVDSEQKELVISGTNNNRTGGRHVTYDPAAKTLTFDGAYYNGSSGNGNCIPLRVYGISL